MSEIAKMLFDSLQAAKEGIQAVAPGLKDFGQETGAELSRLGTQGAMELSSALFSGHAFVPYGPGQYTPSAPEQTQEPAAEHAQEQPGLERGGMER